jgi:hypothetical protein
MESLVNIAEAAGIPVLTRDTGRLQTYFPAQSSHGMVEHWNGGILGRNEL